jgi:hypothetical protein
MEADKLAKLEKIEKKLKKLEGKERFSPRLQTVYIAVIAVLALVVVWFVMNSCESTLMKIPMVPYLVGGGGGSGDENFRIPRIDNSLAVEKYYRNELENRSKSSMDAKESRNKQYVPNASWLNPDTLRSDAAFDRRRARHFGRFDKEIDSDAIAGEWDVPARELDRESVYLHGGSDYF